MVMLKLEEQPPLIQAIFSGELDDVRNLLVGKPDVNCQDAEKRSALHAAAFKGDKDLAELLLVHGARVNTKDSKWLTPLHRACGVGAEDTVALLLKYKADTAARDRQWQTPLHIAAANNAVDCVSHLLNYVPNVNVTDRAGRTALHHAALNGHNDVVDLLISKGCIVNACDKKDCRPIHWAAHLGHVETMEMLIRNGADINVKDRNQYTPLHAAAASGMPYACRLLLNAGADVDAQNAYGNTPLHIACLNGHLPICQELAAYRANLEAVNYRGQTPLHIAAASTHGVGCLHFLLEHDININRQSADGRTPLHMSAIHGRFTRSKTLIDKGAIVDCQDKNGNTALHIAAQYGHDILTATLLGFEADPNKRGYEGRTPLHVCCLSGFVEVSRKFIQASMDLNTRDDTGKTAIHCAAYKGSVECLDLLVSQGADFKLQDHIGRTALHYAAARGHYSCVFTLVGIGSPVNVSDNEGCSALHLAAAYDMEGRCVEYLLQHKADARMKDHRGFTPTHYAVNGSNALALGYLLETLGKNCAFHGPDTPLNTPLHFAARNGDLNILRSVIPYFPDTNIKNETGCTPVLIAAREGHTHCVQMLLRYGAKVSVCEDVYNMSAVHYSAKNGHMHCLALLVDNTEDKNIIDKPDKFNRTALMLAVSGSHRDCVLTLLKSYADPNVVDYDRHSSLFRAVVTDQNNVVQLLISKRALVNVPDVNGKTVLHLAAACGHFSCLQTILQHMQAEEAARLDNHKFSALHWACYYGNATCVEYLLQKGFFKTLEGNLFSPVHCATFAGSERCLELLYNNYGKEMVKLCDARNRTPLHIAALHGHTECARYLLEQGAAIDCNDEMGRTPLIAASQNGQSQILELLIAYKANLKSHDNNGNTALHMACLKRHNHTALLLLEYINSVEIINMINNDRKTALHLSARNGLVEVTRNLIKKGSSVLAVDSNGLTPALCCAPNACVAQCLAIILASHPMQYPITNHSTKDQQEFLKKLFRRFKRHTSSHIHIQTEISLLRDPRELLDDLATKPKSDPSVAKSTKAPRRPLHNHSSPCLQSKSKPRPRRTTDIILIENYDKENDFDVNLKKTTSAHGLGLHRSFSEIALVASPEPDVPQLTLSACKLTSLEEKSKRLQKAYKDACEEIAELTKIRDVSYGNNKAVYVNHATVYNSPKASTSSAQPTPPRSCSLINNRHVEHYEDVFKSLKLKHSLSNSPMKEVGMKQGDFLSDEGVSMDTNVIPRVGRKKCSCLYVCEKCVTKNMFDEDDEEGDRCAYQACVEADAVVERCRESVSTSVGPDVYEENCALLKNFREEGCLSGKPRNMSPSELVAFLCDEQNSTGSLGAISKKCHHKRPQKQESTSNWPKVTVDSGRISMPSDLSTTSNTSDINFVPQEDTGALLSTTSDDSVLSSQLNNSISQTTCSAKAVEDAYDRDSLFAEPAGSAESGYFETFTIGRVEVPHHVAYVIQPFAYCAVAVSDPNVAELHDVESDEVFHDTVDFEPKDVGSKRALKLIKKSRRADDGSGNRCLQSSNSHESFLQRNSHLGSFSMHLRADFERDDEQSQNSDNEYY